MNMKIWMTLMAGSVAGTAAGDVTATFDNDLEGWTTIGDAMEVTWEDAIGQPPGSMQGTDDDVSGTTWFFSASDDFLGDQSLAESVSYDILGVTGNQVSLDGADVMLEGNGMQIGIEFGVQPTIDGWTSWSVDFTEGDWQTVDSLVNGSLSGNSVSQADIDGVLANLEGLYIRGEYTNGLDSAALDNVNLSVIPTPATASLLGLAALGLRRRR